MEFAKRFRPENSELFILFRLTSGLICEKGSIDGDFGVFVYCNRRLIIKSSKAAEFGFETGIAGVQHPRMSNARVIVELFGPTSEMPWISSKTSLNFNHRVFQAIRSDIHTAVKNATALSKKLQPDFDTAIAPFPTGAIVSKQLDQNERLTPSKYPSLPETKKSTREALRDANKTIGSRKPWSVGAYEGIIAVELIKKQRSLQQRNRIMLVILDSTLEIAFKDYLANDVSNPLGDKKLSELFDDRKRVHEEMAKHIATGNTELWTKVQYFYKQRCDLIHKRANTTVSDDQIADYQALIQLLLETMFGLTFPLQEE